MSGEDFVKKLSFAEERGKAGENEAEKRNGRRCGVGREVWEKEEKHFQAQNRGNEHVWEAHCMHLSVAEKFQEQTSVQTVDHY